MPMSSTLHRVARPLLSATLLLLLLLSPRLAWAGGGGGHSVISNIAVCLVAAMLLGFLMKLLRQPSLLGYLGAGVLIGPVGLELISDHSEIVTISEIGLILLLFMIGLEIDLRKMLAAGKWVIVPGLLQFPICVGGSYAIFGLLQSLGVDIGIGTYARLYAAVAVSLSSTMIVVKLLFDKTELDTLPGRITVGILIFQDIWAIIVLAIQPNVNNPELLGIARTFGVGAVLVGLALGLSRWVLPFVFRTVAQVPELMLVISLGWCFLVALVAAHPAVGLSMEMGALIAGVSLATYPYSLEVVAKAISIRDFFITLFFVALGMQIPLPTLGVVVTALAIAAVALLARAVGIFGVLYAAQAGHRTSLLAAINLSQVSEFSLVIAAIGVELGHIDSDTLAYLIWVFALLAVTSTYAVTFSYPLQDLLSRVVGAVGLRDLKQAPVEEKATKHKIVLLGFFRIAAAFLHEITARYPALMPHIKVIDFNPKAKEHLEAMGMAYVYGDISHQDTLHHAAVHDADLVICTIPDSFLRGTTNAKLVKLLKGLCPHSRIVVTAETGNQARELYAEGADYVLESTHVAGVVLADIVDREQDLESMRADAVGDLEERRELVV
jgi:Kef-type K+ transport system membrane component KefB